MKHFTPQLTLFCQITALSTVLYSNVKTLCVPERMGTVESPATSKNVTAVFSSLFLILYVLKYLRQCVRKPYESIKQF